MNKSWRLGIALLSITLTQIQVVPPAKAAAGVYSFTTAGAAGANGPIQESVTAAYAGTTLAGQVTIRVRGIQEWTVPVTDTYTVTVAGASGGTVPLRAGGKGRVITAQIKLTQGQVLKILIGQEGGRAGFTSGWAGGGGGGTFIVDSATAGAILVVGGGGEGLVRHSLPIRYRAGCTSNSCADTSAGSPLSSPRRHRWRLRWLLCEYCSSVDCPASSTSYQPVSTNLVPYYS